MGGVNGKLEKFMESWRNIYLERPDLYGCETEHLLCHEVVDI